MGAAWETQPGRLARLLTFSYPIRPNAQTVRLP